MKACQVTCDPGVQPQQPTLLVRGTGAFSLSAWRCCPWCQRYATLQRQANTTQRFCCTGLLRRRRPAAFVTCMTTFRHKRCAERVVLRCQDIRVVHVTTTLTQLLLYFKIHLLHTLANCSFVVAATWPLSPLHAALTSQTMHFSSTVPALRRHLTFLDPSSSYKHVSCASKHPQTFHGPLFFN